MNPLVACSQGFLQLEGEEEEELDVKKTTGRTKTTTASKVTKGEAEENQLRFAVVSGSKLLRGVARVATPLSLSFCSL